MSGLLLYINYPSWLHPEVFPSIPWLSFLRWYSLSYIIGFLVSRKMVPLTLKTTQGTSLLSREYLDEFVFLGMIGIIIGGRLGYILIYDPVYYFSSWARFLSIFLPFNFTKSPDLGLRFSFTGISGLSYHGALAGIVLACFITSRKRKISFWRLQDKVAPLSAFLYTFGRLGNFANQELYGKVTSNSLGMLFPDADPVVTKEPWARKIAEATGLISSEQTDIPFTINLPRHPSQLYESFFEGLFLGSILLIMVMHNKKIIPGIVFSTYFFGYGLLRFLIEYVREPDPGIGFLIKLGTGSEDPQVFTSFLNFSMGQILCTIMMLIGIVTASFLSYFHVFCRKLKDPSLPTTS